MKDCSTQRSPSWKIDGAIENQLLFTKPPRKDTNGSTKPYGSTKAYGSTTQKGHRWFQDLNAYAWVPRLELPRLHVGELDEGVAKARCVRVHWPRCALSELRFSRFQSAAGGHFAGGEN